MREGFGHSQRVAIDEEFTVGIEADVEVLGTELEPFSGQITSATTTTLATASAGKVFLIKRCQYAVNVNQAIVDDPFEIQYVDADNNTKTIDTMFNPQTGASYGINVVPDFYKGGTAKTIKIVTPTGFTDKLNWTLAVQEVDA